MPKSAYLRTQLVIAVVILIGSLISIGLGRDIFPFSNYPMYSKTLIPDPHLQLYTVVATDLNDRIVWLKPYRYMKPFWGASFREALLAENDPTRIQTKLDAAATWYRNSVAGNPSPEERAADGIKNLRLYQHLVPWNEVQDLAPSGRTFNELLIKHSELKFESRTP